MPVSLKAVKLKLSVMINYFDLLPHEPVTIHVATSLSKAEFDKQLQSMSISDAY